jgi:hypothetical protein
VEDLKVSILLPYWNPHLVPIFNELEKLSENHAEPELFDHFFIYKGQTPFLEWWDAFFDPIALSSEVSESDVYNFAGKLGLKVEKLIKPKG